MDVHNRQSPRQDGPRLSRHAEKSHNHCAEVLARLVSGTAVNAPWGLAQASLGFGPFSGDLLVGNYGDGTISAFDPNSGALLGQLLDPGGNLVTISGLWALDFREGGFGLDPNALYFDAGLNGGNDGLFGELQPVLSNVVPGPIAGAGIPGLLLAGGGLIGDGSVRLK